MTLALPSTIMNIPLVGRPKNVVKIDVLTFD